MPKKVERFSGRSFSRDVKTPKNWALTPEAQSAPRQGISIRAALKRTILKLRPAIFPCTPLIQIACANAIQRPTRAARDVIGAGIGDFRVPRFINLPESTALSAIAGGFRAVTRLVRHNPFRDVRVYARGPGGALNIRANRPCSVRRGRRYSPGRRHCGGHRPFPDLIFSRTRKRHPNNGQ
jgi:hypothetical protein